MIMELYTQLVIFILTHQLNILKILNKILYNGLNLIYRKKIILKNWKKIPNSFLIKNLYNLQYNNNNLNNNNFHKKKNIIEILDFIQVVLLTL